MPTISEGKAQMPVWCEMTHFEIVHLSPGQHHSFARIGKKEKLIVGQGQCRISYDGHRHCGRAGRQSGLDHRKWHNLKSLKSWLIPS